MALKNNYRQYPLVAEQLVEVADILTAGVSGLTVDLPPGAILTGGGLLVVSESNATGAATLSVGTTGGAAAGILAATTIKAKGYTPFTGTGAYFPSGGSINMTSALPAGMTAGVLRLIVEYIIVDRGNEVG